MNTYLGWHRNTLRLDTEDEWPTEAFTCFGTPTAWADERWRAPVALWVRGAGRLDELGARAVAVVGARAATGYGEHVAAEFGYGLAEGDVVVVSGAAFGIDGAAHRGALAAQGRTVAVQACGLDRAYPAGHQRLLDRVAECAAMVSEYPPSVRPARYRFFLRTTVVALGLGIFLTVRIFRPSLEVRVDVIKKFS